MTDFKWRHGTWVEPADREDLDEAIKRSDLLEDQNEKLKTAIEAQKKYIGGLTNAMELSDTAREKMKQEVEGKREKIDSKIHTVFSHQKASRPVSRASYCIQKPIRG